VRFDTDRLKVAVCVAVAERPVTVTVYVPDGAAAVADTCSGVDEPAAMLAEPSVAVTADVAGCTDVVSVRSLDPPRAVVETVDAVVVPAGAVAEVGVTAIEKSAAGAGAVPDVVTVMSTDGDAVDPSAAIAVRT
jgi:hypothetical protein